MGAITDKGARNVGSWRTVRPTDEPIYCPAPSLSSPDDVICPGSDDEADEAAKVAKRLRYEHFGRRYLQGRPIRILSASLRGPFDKSLGWQNPWLPKPASQHEYCPNKMAQPGAPPAMHHEADMPVGVLLTKADDMNPDPNDSIECHLPSPQSHEDLQFIESPPQFEKRSRIRSWAEQVREGSFQEEQFWAPGHDPVNSNIKTANKRPAEREWLKRRPTKKKRPDASQSTGLTSTPTTTPISPSRRSNKNGSDVRKGAANRSFEMTTPSSSPDHGPKESLYMPKNRPATLCDEERQPAPSATPIAGSSIRTVPLSQNRNGETDERERQERRNAGASNDMRQQQSQSQSHYSVINSYQTIDFQDCADDSFCYRTRHLNQVTPLTKSSTTVPHKSDTKAPSSNSKRTSGNRHRPRVSETSNDRSATTIKANVRADNLIATTVKPGQGLVKDYEVVLQKCDTTDTGAATSSSFRMNIDRPPGDIDSDEHTDNLNTYNNGPPAVLPVKGSQGASPELLLDEGSTLIGDPTDTEQPGEVQAAQPISAKKQAYLSKILQDDDAEIPNEAHNVNDNMSYVAATTLQHEVEESQSIINQPSHRCLRKNVTDSTIEAQGLKSQLIGGTPGVTDENQTIAQQSPWMPISAFDGSVNLGNDSFEQTKDQYTTPSVSLGVSLLKSPAPMYQSPMIRPSQQSPWAQDIMEPINDARRGLATCMGPTITVDTESPGKRAGRLLPVNQEHSMWSSPAAAILPGPCNSPCMPREHQRSGSDAIIGEERANPQIQSSPHTPISQTRQSTPEGEVSIRSFSNFNCTSPQKSIHYPGSSTNRSILSTRKDQSTGTDSKSSKRVSFAPLPHEQDDDDDGQPSTNPRAASPPPPTLVDLEGEDVDGKYRGHFNIMNRRFSAHRMQKPRYQQRLLPSASQQKPESPPIDAMARVFQEADVHRLNRVANVVQTTEAGDGKPGAEEAGDGPQSPWRQDSQSADDVAAVIGHLDEFLDVWDVNTEMARNRAELDEAGRHEARPKPDMSVIQGVNVW